MAPVTLLVLSGSYSDNSAWCTGLKTLWNFVANGSVASKLYMWEAGDFSENRDMWILVSHHKDQQSHLVRSYISKTLRNFVANGSVASKHIYVAALLWGPNTHSSLFMTLVDSLVCCCKYRHAVRPYFPFGHWWEGVQGVLVSPHEFWWQIKWSANLKVSHTAVAEKISSQASFIPW